MMTHTIEEWLEKALAPILAANEHISTWGLRSRVKFSQFNHLTRMTTKQIAALVMIIHLRRETKEVSDDEFMKKLAELLPQEVISSLQNLPFILWAIGWAGATASHGKSFTQIRKVLGDDVTAVVIMTLHVRRHQGDRDDKYLRRYLLRCIPENSIIFFCLNTTGAEYMKRFYDDFLSRYTRTAAV